MFTEVRIGHDPEPAREANERGRRLRLRHLPRDRADRRVCVREERGPRDERRYARAGDLRQPSDGLPRACETLAKRRGDVARAGGPSENVERSLGGDDVALGLFARADGERGSEPGEQRWMPEALAGREDVSDLAFVDHVHRSRPDHVERGRGTAVLDENRFARRIRPDLDGRCDPLELVVRKAAERREPREEPPLLVHRSTRACSSRSSPTILLAGDRARGTSVEACVSARSPGSTRSRFVRSQPFPPAADALRCWVQVAGDAHSGRRFRGARD